jgi:putative hydrolase of the HAD superfamily
MAAVVFFDLDGTLLDESALPGAVRGACELVSAATGVDVDRLLEANTATWQELWPELEEEWMLGRVDDDEVGERSWSGTLARCGIRDSSLVRTAVATYRELERRAHRIYPEVPAVLDSVRRSGHRIGLITNGASGMQRGKLAAVGLSTAFDPTVVSSEVGVRKPDPGIFEHALVQAAVGPADAWHVGDNPWVDVRGAAAAGLRTVWVNRTGLEQPADAPRADLEVTTLDGLPGLLCVRTPGTSSRRTG